MTGKIKLIIGPMGAGKTTELIRFINRSKAVGKTVYIYTFKGDNRFDATRLATHDNISSLPVNNYVSEMPEVIPDVNVIIIDEAQFIGGVAAFAEKAAMKNIDVYIGSLVSDYKRMAFPNLAELITIAGEIVHLLAYCKLCGNDAPFTHSLENMPSVIKIGGMESYMPLCRECWLQLAKK